MRLTVVALPHPVLARQRGCYVAPATYAALQADSGGEKKADCPDPQDAGGTGHVGEPLDPGAGGGSNGAGVNVMGAGMPLLVRPCPAPHADAIADHELAIGHMERRGMRVSPGSSMEVMPLPKTAFRLAAALRVSVALIRSQKERRPTREQAPVTLEAAAVRRACASQLQGHVVMAGQAWVVACDGALLRCRLQDVWLGEHDEPAATAAAAQPASPGVMVQVVPRTRIAIGTLHEKSGLQLTGSWTGLQPPVVDAAFDMAALGIGGLQEQLASIYRRILLPRRIPADLRDRLRCPVPRGVLLYGPPGCGKTLIARQLGKALCGEREPKIVNGPELMDSYVGVSERNLRNVFADAEREQRDKGGDSRLHVIVFDELDALAPRRGAHANDGGSSDRMVNQLLTSLDGVTGLDNVLVIGTTNRKDMLDEALLRPGRLELHIEVGLPDAAGRAHILRIHTDHMQRAGLLAPDVNLQALADGLRNYTGAELRGVVTNAASLAMERTHGMQGEEEDGSLRLHQADFLRAAREMVPAFGVQAIDLQRYAPHGVIPFAAAPGSASGAASTTAGAAWDACMRAVQQLRCGTVPAVQTLLLYGRPGAGRTALTATLASCCDLPFVHRIGGDTLLRDHDEVRANAIVDAFQDAGRSDLSLLVLDDLERLLEYVPTGPRFNGAVLQALLVLLNQSPPRGTRLLVVGTTAMRPALKRLGLVGAFQDQVALPLVATEEQVEAVVAALHPGAAPPAVMAAARRVPRPVPIKHLLRAVTAAAAAE